MNKSESIKELAKALSDFQGKCEAISLNKNVKVTMKSGGNYFFKYATFDHILNIVKPVLNEFGLSFTQLLEKQGVITTVLMHSSGEWISTTTEVQSTGSIQDLGGHYSYLKRYALCGILGVIGEEDDDANGSVGNTVEDVKTTLRPDHPDYHKVVSWIADGKGWDYVLSKFLLPKGIKEEIERDVAKKNNPVEYGVAGKTEIVDKVRELGRK